MMDELSNMIELDKTMNPIFNPMLKQHETHFLTMAHG
jgi:hypothetical protein